MPGTVIRSERSFSPINAEKTTLSLEIWRFNFGWLETKRFVQTTDTFPSPEPNEIVKETVLVRVTGDGLDYYEQSSVIPHPSGFESPVGMPTVAQQELPTYSKTGVTIRTSSTVSMGGTGPTIYAVGSLAFDLSEKKIYPATPDTAPKDEMVINARDPIIPVGTADNSLNIIAANGVTTATLSKG